MLIGNGKFEFIFWAVVGGYFHVPNWSFEDFPIDLAKIDSAAREQLKRFVPQLESAMNNAVQFKMKCRRRVGINRKMSSHYRSKRFSFREHSWSG